MKSLCASCRWENSRSDLVPADCADMSIGWAHDEILGGDDFEYILAVTKCSVYASKEKK